MKVLVVGGGGREHALVWKISQSPMVDKIYAVPGNAGIAEAAECIPVSADDTESILKLAVEKGIHLTVVGPEAPLVDGIVDIFTEKGLRIFGFNSMGARLEGSKVWAKEFMKRHGIPTGTFSVYDDPGAALEAVESHEPPFVIKADGLAAGKGVLIAESLGEAREAIEKVMVKKVFGDAGNRVVVEEYLTGDEISILAVFDGDSYRLLVPSQDHKRAYEGDKGPNTGGMGAYAPVPLVKSELAARIRKEIIEPTFAGMQDDKIAGVGVLYFGLIITADGPKVLEYNCRFGDPETQVILPLFEGDLFEVMYESTARHLERVSFSNSDKSTACIVIASGGYPGSYQKGYPIEGIEEASRRGCIVFHAGTTMKGGRVHTSGGRVLGVTAVAKTLQEALQKAYKGVDAIHFTDSFCRGDIGKRSLQTI